MFIFLVNKKDKRKERLFLLANNKVKIFTKNEKNPFFKPNKEKPKEKQIKDENNQTENEKTENENGDANNNNDMNEDLNISKENDDTQNEVNNSITLEKQKEMQGKELSKINISSKYDKKFNLPKNRMKICEAPTILYDEGFHIAFGGFWSGIIIIKQLIEYNSDIKNNKNRKMNIIKTGEDSPITKMIIDKTETFILCCNLEGTVYIYIIDQNDKLTWNLHKKINEGQGEISSIALNENLSIFTICFKNGYCNSYTFPNCKLFNSFRIEEKDLNSNKFTAKESKDSISDKETPEPQSMPSSNKVYFPDITIISSSPLPCYVFYIKERKSLCIYSINAHFIKEKPLGYDIMENGIKKYTDLYFRDNLFIYNSNKNTIDVHRLIDLKLVISSPVIDDQFIDFQFTKDLDYAFILTKVKQKAVDKSSLMHKILLLRQSTSDTGKNPYFVFN